MPTDRDNSYVNRQRDEITHVNRQRQLMSTERQCMSTDRQLMSTDREKTHVNRQR